MANRFPLIVDSVNENIKELPSGDNLDLTGNDALFGDNDKAIFGAGSDLQIYHDGDNSYIRDTGTGNLNVSGDEVRILNAGNSELKALFTTDGAVELYHDNSQKKLATTSTGIDVTGEVQADSLDIDGTADNIIQSSDATFKVTNTTGNGRRFLFSHDANSDDPGDLLTSKSAMIQVLGTDGDGDQVPHIALIATDVDSMGGALTNRLEMCATRSTKSELASSTFTSLTDGDYLGSLIFSGDDGTDIRTIGAEIRAEVNGTPSTNDLNAQLHLRVDGHHFLSISDGETVVNENSRAHDFRVESDSNTHALFIDAGTSRVGINKSSLVADLDVGGSILVDNTQTLSVDTNLSAGQMSMGQVNDGGGWGLVGLGWAGGAAGQTASFGVASQTFYFGLGDGSSSGSLASMLQMSRSETVFNNNGLDIDFRVESDSNTHALFIDSSDNSMGVYVSNPNSTSNHPDTHLMVKGGISFNEFTASTEGSLPAITQWSSDGTAQDLVIGTRSGTGKLLFYTGNAGSGGDWGATSNAERLRITAGGNVVFNDGGADADFRVESDSNTHMLFVDAGNNRVGVNTSTPDATFEVAGDVWARRIRVTDDGSTSPLVNIKADDASPWAFQIQNDTYSGTESYGFRGFMANGGDFTWQHNAASYQSVIHEVRNNTTSLQTFKYGSYGAIFNENSNDMDFRVESDSNANMFVVDAGLNAVGVGVQPSTNYRTLTVVNALDTDNSQIHIHGGNAGLYIGESYTGGFGNNAAIARALVAGYHVVSSQVGDLCIGAETGAGIRFGTQASGSGLTNRMYISENGAVSIAGSLSKGSGSFNIDHPLPEKNETHHLVHSFVEAPQADNIYRGKVDLVAGQATVNIDTVAGMTEGTFAALNREIQCFTSNETGWTAVRGSVTGNILTIEAQDNTCTDTISWLVIGERQDQHMYDTEWTDENGKVIVEPLKS